MGLDRLQAPIDFLKEGRPQPGLLTVVVLRCLVQFSFGEPVKLGSIHSFQLSPSVRRRAGRLQPAVSQSVGIQETPSPSHPRAGAIGVARLKASRTRSIPATHLGGFGPIQYRLLSPNGSQATNLTPSSSNSQNS